MRTNDDGRFFFLLIGLGLGAIGGLIAALLAREKTVKRCARAAKRALST